MLSYTKDYSSDKIRTLDPVKEELWFFSYKTTDRDKAANSQLLTFSTLGGPNTCNKVFHIQSVIHRCHDVKRLGLRSEYTLIYTTWAKGSIPHLPSTQWIHNYNHVGARAAKSKAREGTRCGNQRCQ